jgi:hypothetical protein
MAASVADFLSRAAARGFVWGKHDCMLFAADWALELTGTDPAQRWRGTYTDPWQAMKIVNEANGAQALMHAGLAEAGWQPIDVRRAATGDIVLAHVPRHEDVAAGVCVEGKAALITRKGLVVWPCPFIAAWHHG